MRAVGLMDLYHAARAVQVVCPEKRERACAQLIWQAHVADKYVKRLGKLHPLWGDGSLRAVACRYFKEETRGKISTDLLACVSIVALALARRHI